MVHGRSDIGLVRENNEDAWYADSDTHFYVLCDGMGGHSAGEVAAQEAIGAICKSARKVLGGEQAEDLAERSEQIRDLIQEANHSVYSLAQKDRELKGMGTTLCCVHLQGRGMVVGHVGDSRVYLFRDQALTQLTDDHSLVAELLELGELNQRQARDCTYRNIITRAIGQDPTVEASIHVYDLFPGDEILLCSDGLSDMLDTSEIEKILNSEESVENSIDRLVQAANQNGGHDNITAILLKLTESHE